ncbi:LPS export ABC transporter periplasmic protein LptC [Mariniphaga sediminis]|jgi:LPS export ABC transporter protein LptC|uniref:LPS export ABC transporter periplasmic protein LptC n=1 Tax=Mariniphaga sediminis TaxID=1628158 RepID=A0A399D6K7_9BACT|nr:LPS export ABC transporter periplasmic protein LptC [Mariniphaga sediminis]RIH66262.1 LPS export ABC transporter periplasmic protein LptC [Mariniphaga sediminis]
MKAQKSGSKAEKIFYFLKIAALFTGAAFLFSACEDNIEKIKAFSSPENLPVLEATNFETMFTDSGEVRFFLKAPKLLRFETDGKSFAEFPEGIELIKYDEKQNIISSITADYAKQFEKEKKWEAKNNVVATNAQGDTLKTEHLIWEEKEEKIYTEEFVRIVRTDQIITGIGFVSDQSLQNWRIKNPKGTIYVDVQDNQEQNDTDTLRSPQSQQGMTLQRPGQQPLKLGN